MKKNVIVVIHINGKHHIPQVVEAPENFKPKHGATYMVLTSEADGVYFTLGVVKKLLKAKCVFTIWEVSDVDSTRETGTIQVW